MTDRELMQQALDALQEYVGVVVSVNDPNDWTPKVADAGEPARKAIEALRARLTEQEPYAAQAAMVASQTQGRMRIDPVTGDVGIGNPNQVTLDTSGATGFSLTPIDWGKNT